MKKIVGVAVVGLVGLAALFYFRGARVMQALPVGEPGPSVGGGDIVNNPGAVVAIMEGAKNLFTPRGIRNNNPLNIKWNSVQTWNGEVGRDEQYFLIFDKPENGIRAAARILSTYRNNGVTSVANIIKRWTSGDSVAVQEAYIAHVAGGLGLGPNDEVTPARWFELLKLMIKHENGQQPYLDSVIRNGIAAA